MKARIYYQTKPVTQSAPKGLNQWVLEFIPANAPDFDPLTGWTNSFDTSGWQRMFFATLELALDYAQKNELDFTVDEPGRKTIKPKNYADNFRMDRRMPWTH